MKKKYVLPQAVICDVKVEPVLETASINTGSPLTEGVFKGESKKHLIDDFEYDDDDDYEDFYKIE